MRCTLTTATIVALAVHSARSKAVFARFMVANSQSFDSDQWKVEISSAQNIGIQGFALNTANDTNYEPAQIATAYSVAESLNFKLHLSFDFSYPWNASSMASTISTHANSTSMFKWNDDILVSTFGGDDGSHPDSFWADLKSSLSSKGVGISLAPAFTSYRDPNNTQSLLSTYQSIDGFFNYWSWPQDVNQTLTTDTDLAYQSAINTSRSGPYIMSVSPWQFKNLGSSGGDPTNDWVELSDTLIKYRWEQVINDVHPDIVQIVSWNDYAESHYIAALNPQVAMDPAAHAYVDGKQHQYWQIIMQHYISWYLNGTEPAVAKDQIVVWYRLHPKASVCKTPSYPRNAAYPADAVFAFALLTSPATVTMDMGLGNHVEWQAPTGVSIGQVPFPAQDGQIPFMEIIRNGQIVESGYGSAFWNMTCETYDFNPFVDIIPNPM
ncbi:glycoside hydrolase family 71 protein [Peniophora sp. CONT]|nr:glycoside hydrolase family 71 protein [Peniophora sp. CONT]